mgnify:CR=1 FL=1
MITLPSDNGQSVKAEDRRNREEMMLVFDTISDMDNVRITALTGAGRVFSAHTNAAKSPVTSRIAEHSPKTTEEMSLRGGYRFEQTVTSKLSGYVDSKEAMLAFTKKQPPVFTGH